MSAHPAEVLVKHGLAQMDFHFLAKPFTRGEALAKVREALERRKSPRPETRAPDPSWDAASRAKTPYRILLVDDEDGIRSSLTKLLTKAGYSVTEARDGQEAIQLWRENPGDLVILDMFMPEKDGIETIVELKAHNPAVRIIAISGGGAKNRVDILEDAKLLGADLVLAKPFDAAELLNMIGQVVNYSA
jgi:DNA-binding response OmpR family regulator